MSSSGDSWALISLEIIFSGAYLRITLFSSQEWFVSLSCTCTSFYNLPSVLSSLISRTLNKEPSSLNLLSSSPFGLEFSLLSWVSFLDLFMDLPSKSVLKPNKSFKRPLFKEILKMKWFDSEEESAYAFVEVYFSSSCYQSSCVSTWLASGKSTSLLSRGSGWLADLSRWRSKWLSWSWFQP